MKAMVELMVVFVKKSKGAEDNLNKNYQSRKKTK